MCLKRSFARRKVNMTFARQVLDFYDVICIRIEIDTNESSITVHEKISKDTKYLNF